MKLRFKGPSSNQHLHHQDSGQGPKRPLRDMLKHGYLLVDDAIHSKVNRFAEATEQKTKVVTKSRLEWLLVYSSLMGGSKSFYLEDLSESKRFVVLGSDLKFLSIFTMYTAIAGALIFMTAKFACDIERTKAFGEDLAKTTRLPLMFLGAVAGVEYAIFGLQSFAGSILVFVGCSLGLYLKSSSNGRLKKFKDWVGKQLDKLRTVLSRPTLDFQSTDKQSTGI